MRALIVNADDFGAHVAVNEAVEQAHTRGILTSASLMMGAVATDDAVARARRLSGLAVGLHVTVADGRPILPPARVPALVDASGMFRNDLFGSGVRWFAFPAVRAQLAAEIAAQFAAFAATGLRLDHVNVHKHLHAHPTVGALVAKLGRIHDARGMRIPDEPRAIVRRAAPGERVPRGLPGQMLWLLRRQAARAGLPVNDRVFGLAWSGAMTEARLLALIPCLPEGVSELYLHPATEDARSMPHAVPTYLYREELEALISPAVHDVIATHGVSLATYSGVSGSGVRGIGGPSSAGMTSRTQTSV